MQHKKPSQIGNALLSWFKRKGRIFPWRETNDPYAILLAEKLLQQTAVRPGTVDIYRKLLQQYPCIHDLSLADSLWIKELIFPLGLHYRANELTLMAKNIEKNFNGVIPNDLKSLLSIYGIGDYSARAILSFAFGEDVAVVDTNIARILFRLFGLSGKPPQNPARSRLLINMASSLVPPRKSKEFNWGLIDLGALVCMPAIPVCSKCPLRKLCAYGISSTNKNQGA